MTTSPDAIIDLVREYGGYRGPLGADDDLFDKAGIDGDDATEFLELYSKRFGVDLAPYRWYFHHGEEGLNPAALFIRTPDRQVERIPLTARLLSEGASNGAWPIQYPPHTVPARRLDRVINIVILSLMACLAGVIVYAKF